jgi:hypothetical protein
VGAFLTTTILFACLFYGAFIYRVRFSAGGHEYFTLVDDAMISMRYARNLASGSGLVWNPSDLPVQGYTNLGWTLLMALLHLLRVPESLVSLLVMAAASILVLGTSLISFRIVIAMDPNAHRGALVAAAITSFYFPLVYWSLRGMEVAALTFGVSLSVLLAIRLARHPLGRTLPILLGLAILLLLVMRLDALLQVAVFLGFAFLVARASRNWFSIAAPALLAAGGLITILLWQEDYYGSALPNTYFLKVVGVSAMERWKLGVQVFVEYATRDFLMPLVIIGAGLLFFRGMRKKEYLLLLALFVVQCVYSIHVGGDYAEPLDAPQVDAANRFITQGMPALIALFAITCERFLKALQTGSEWLARQSVQSETLTVLAISVATLVVMSGQPWFRWAVRNAPLLDSDIWRAQLGLHIRDNTAPDATIAAHAVGNIAYYSERRTIDLLGMSDPVVARGNPATWFRPGHNKWNYEYSILTLAPDLVADEWEMSSTFLNGAPDYFRLQNGIWVRRDSNLLNLDGLEEDYRE